VFQRAHQQSDRALCKDYRFVSWPLEFELGPVIHELQREPLDWLASQWKWHIETRFCVLRAGQRQAYPGSELTHGHSVDQPNLARLGAARALIERAFPVQPRLAWLGFVPAGARIFLHVDNTQHWDEHHRVHVPLVTTPSARLCVAERFLFLRPGRLWLINNSLPHGVLNRGPDRLHLVLDLPDFAGFEAWLASGQTEPGEPDAEALAELSQDPLRVPAATCVADPALQARLRAQ
jgi:Aspartyl/Asparaginyl beta-hydroxylase